MAVLQARLQQVSQQRDTFLAMNQRASREAVADGRRAEEARRSTLAKLVASVAGTEGDAASLDKELSRLGHTVAEVAATLGARQGRRGVQRRRGRGAPDARSRRVSATGSVIYVQYEYAD